MSTLSAILILLAVAVLLVALLRRAHLPPIVAYLLTGILVGPYGLGWIQNDQDVQLLAEFGVVFLLFTLGLEFSLPRLMAMKHAVFTLGSSQVVITTLTAAALAFFGGVEPVIALVIGGAFAMSSTAILIKQLGEQAETNLLHGRLAVGVLLFQDIAFVPFLILIPALAMGQTETLFMDLAWALTKGTGAFIALVLMGRYLLRPLLHEIAGARSAELFTLAVLLTVLGAAALTHQLGLSYALGAFIAGMMLGETEFRHQVEADIRPFRDVLLGLFFITVGMLLNLTILADTWYWVLAAVAAVIVFKAVTITLLSRGFCPDWFTAGRTGVVLAQGGEFGFALLTLGITTGILAPNAGQVALATMVISMLLAPVLIRYNAAIAGLFFRGSERKEKDVLQHDISKQQQLGELHEHVIICGYGRVGQNVARFMEEENQDYIALDLDPLRVRLAREAGDPVYYGDYTNPDTLHAAGIDRARVIVATYYEPSVSLKLLRAVRRQRSDIPVLVRTRDDSRLEELQQAGATEVIPETLEASLMVVSHLLALLDVPMARILRKIQRVRGDRYSLMRSVFRGQDARPIDESHAFREQLQTVTLTPESHGVGKTIRELQLAQGGILVTAVRREGILGKQPAPDTLLREGDVLVLYGKPEDLEHSEEVLLGG